MILTVTLNPSIDISYRLQEFKLDTANRCQNTIKTAGGKGLNVSRVLKQLDGDLIATGFLGGKTGEFIKEELDKIEIENDFLFTTKSTRNCIAILVGESQTEILEQGEEIDEKEQEQFLEKFSNLVKKVDIVTISGSSPKGIKNKFIEKMIEISNQNNCKVIADVSGNLLKEMIFSFKHKPYAVKPNIEEFKELIGKDEDIEIKSELLENIKDIELTILSCSGDGSYIKFENKVYKVDIPKIIPVNPVGSGDSTVAGLAKAIDENYDLVSAVKLANVCGISNCMQEKTGYIDIDEIERLKEQINIYEI